MANRTGRACKTQEEIDAMSPEERAKYLRIHENNMKAKLRKQGEAVPYLRKRVNPEELSEEEFQKWQRNLENSRRRNEKMRLLALGIDPDEEKPMEIEYDVCTSFAPDMYQLSRTSYLVTQTYILRWILEEFTGVILPDAVTHQLGLLIRRCDGFLKLNAANDTLKVNL